MCPMWVFTVPSLMKSVDPISALLAPRPISMRTSRSRSVSSASRAADCARGIAVVRYASSTGPATAGSSQAPPEPTVRVARIRSSPGRP